MKHWNRRIALGLIFSLLITGCALFSCTEKRPPQSDCFGTASVYE